MQICTKYGLYPWQLLEYTNSYELLLNSNNGDNFRSDEPVFLLIPILSQPIEFNYKTREKSFFFPEEEGVFYYYCAISANFNFKQFEKDILESIQKKMPSPKYSISSIQEVDCDYSLQVCIDTKHVKFDSRICKRHIELELYAAYRHFLTMDITIPISASYFSYYTEVTKNPLFLNSDKIKESCKQYYTKIEQHIFHERMTLKRLHGSYGGYNSKTSNFMRSVGLYIWDLQELHGIAHEVTEAFLVFEDEITKKPSKDTKDIPELSSVIKKIKNDNNKLYQQLTNVKTFLKTQRLAFERKHLHQAYSQVDKMIENCLEHPLYTSI